MLERGKITNTAATTATTTNPTASSLSIDDFNIGNKLARGRFGHVYKVIKKDTSIVYAMKVLFKSELLENNCLTQVLKEVEIQSKLRHKYILRLFGVCQDNRRIYLFTDMAENGSLYSTLKRIGKFPEIQAGKYLKQLLNALIYIHHKDIIHRDIKPENLLLSKTGNLLLADFGWSSSIDSTGRYTVCGTPDYLSPEMLTNQVYTKVVDSYTCGVLCYEFIVGNAPFTGSNSHETYANILKGSYQCPEGMSDGCQSFISCALRTNPEKRYTAGELYLHAWMQEQDENAVSIIEYETETNSKKHTSLTVSGSHNNNKKQKLIPDEIDLKLNHCNENYVNM